MQDPEAMGQLTLESPLPPPGLGWLVGGAGTKFSWRWSHHCPRRRCWAFWARGRGLEGTSLQGVKSWDDLGPRTRSHSAAETPPSVSGGCSLEAPGSRLRPLGSAVSRVTCRGGEVGVRASGRDGGGAGSRGASGGAAAAHRPVPGHHGARLLACGPGAGPRRVRALLPPLPVRRRLRPGRGAARLRALPARLPPAGRRYPRGPLPACSPPPRQDPPARPVPFSRPDEAPSAGRISCLCHELPAARTRLSPRGPLAHRRAVPGLSAATRH